MKSANRADLETERSQVNASLSHLIKKRDLQRDYDKLLRIHVNTTLRKALDGVRKHSSNDIRRANECSLTEIEEEFVVPGTDALSDP